MPKTKTQTAEVAITADTESEVAEIIAKYVQCSSTGLIVSHQMPFEDWLKAAPLYEELFRKSTWMWGDYLLHGDKTYGERHAQAIGDYKDGYIDNVVSVCARFDHSRRRPGIGFTLHAAAASLHPSDADSLLIRAERERWSRADVAREVAKIHEINGTKPKRGKRSKSKVVHSGVNNPGPTLDGHVTVEPQQTPLYWNGYPLSTRYRIVYQGKEEMSAAEADSAAHFHKLAHGPALVAWLEEHGFTRKEETTCHHSTKTENVSSPSGATPSDPAPAPISDLLPGSVIDYMRERLAKLDEYCTEQLHNTGPGESPWSTEVDEEIAALRRGIEFADRGTLAFADAQPTAPEPDSTASAPVDAQVEPNANALLKMAFALKVTSLKKERDELRSITATMQALIDGLQLDVKNLKAELDEARVRGKKERDGAMHSSETWELMHAKRHEELQQAIAELDDAREQLKRQIEISGDLKGMESVLDEVASRSPEERAEHHISAFNEIIPKVDWAALKTLTLKKWQGNLLRPVDELIDLLDRIKTSR